MTNNNTWSAATYPDDIAGALMYDLELDDGSDKAETIRKNLVDALYWLRAAAENPYDDDKFRALYTVLEAMEEKIEEEIPFWDRED